MLKLCGKKFSCLKSSHLLASWSRRLWTIIVNSCDGILETFTVFKEIFKSNKESLFPYRTTKTFLFKTCKSYFNYMIRKMFCSLARFWKYSPMRYKEFEKFGVSCIRRFRSLDSRMNPEYLYSRLKQMCSIFQDQKIASHLLLDFQVFLFFWSNCVWSKSSVRLFSRLSANGRNRRIGENLPACWRFAICFILICLHRQVSIARLYTCELTVGSFISEKNN